MFSNNTMLNNEAEITRLIYKYRKLIREGKAKLPQEEAMKLIGPDTAYHLYFSVSGRRGQKRKPGRK
ncbi:MAG: hypothetical protein JW807_09640 [Spirochaetes bacterium]|nr:hypothetical protein [Spirochaetota bacterium]